MKISIATTAGFCMGVRRAVELVLDSPNRHPRPIFTHGPLIHNPQVLALLEEKGISILNDIPDSGTGTVLIRAHGVPPGTKEKLEAAGFAVVDATCPRVIKVQSIIVKHARQGYASIIIGDREHPEVQGLLGYAGEMGVVVDTLKALEELPEFDRAIIVAQTTQNTTLFEAIKAWASSNRPHYRAFDTICDSTIKRQDEVSRLADIVDAVIVVGGKDSGNTQRLTEIARQAGKPAFHVESESELDSDMVGTAEKIGITAGASTPNWIIRRVYSKIEALEVKGALGWRRLLYSVQRNLLLKNIYVSLGAGCLGYACTKLQGIPYDLSHSLVAVLYVQSMHILNHLTGSNADQFNDPDRAAFYSRYKIPLALLAIVSGGAGLMAASGLGMVPFVILLIMSLMGLSYNLRLVPERFGLLRYRRIKDIPGSKTVLIAVAWGVVTVILPSFSLQGDIGITTMIVFVWSTAMVFVRTAFFDILDMQGDRIVGKETIPILVGEERTLALLKTILLTVLVLLVVSSLLHLIPYLALGLAICPILMAGVLIAHERGRMHASIRLEFAVDTHFLIAGALTFLWYLV
ncbi:MAG: 4-hydroxy-3-methylbut-2-enyl diphosphate reductase [Desulfobacterales bacterium]